MKTNARRFFRAAGRWAICSVFFIQVTELSGSAYDLGTSVADMRLSQGQAGTTACPQVTRFDVATPGTINREWSTALGVAPATIITADQSSAGRLVEIESAIQQSLSVWTSVAGSSLKPASLGTLQRTTTASACNSSDGTNSICFDQNDPAFATGVLAFTRVVSADSIGEQISPVSPPSTFVGEILDADVLLRPGDPNSTFATPAALSLNPNSYDLESILTHELGHSFGFNHSGVWRAMMFPFAPPPGQIAGTRPTPTAPDAPLADDDRTGLRALYPDPTDSVHVGTISGRVLPANPLDLPVSPPGVTGVFPAQVVALDSSTGAVAASVIAGWSCSDPGPAKFDGSFLLQHLSVGPSQTYEIYAEPLDGPVTLGNVIYSVISVCRNAGTDPGWPEQYSCAVPELAAPFSVAVRAGP